jgi:FlaA1/EpsC-like NDP-sugar epimerase
VPVALHIAGHMSNESLVRLDCAKRCVPYSPWFGQMILSLGYKRRIVEMGLDSLLVAAAYYGAVLLRDNSHGITPLSVSLITARLPLLLTATYAAFFSCRIYQSVWQNVGIEDVPRFAAAAAYATAGAGVLLYIDRSGVLQSTVILYGLLLFNLLAFSRLSLRFFRVGVNKLVQRLGHRILIIGTGGNAELALQQLAQNPASERAGLLVGFVDRDPFKFNKLIHGHRVLGNPANLDSLYQRNQFNLIVVADDSLSPEQFNHILTFAQSHNVELRRYAVHEDTLAPLGSADSGAVAPQLAS